MCVNRARQRGEIGAIRDNKHKLSIKLQKPTYQDGSESDLILYQDITSHDNVPLDDVELVIKAGANPAVEGFELYQNGDFDRLGPSDPNDFRWVVNMHTLHGADDLTPTANQNYPLSKIYISNGLFYAHKLDRELLFERVEPGATGNSNRGLFGNVAETIGVKIEADEVEFKIRIGDKVETHSLKHVPGLPYRIEIRNVDPDAEAVYSDMPDYYKYLASASGKQVELTPVIEDSNDGEGGSISQKDFCHPIVIEEPGSIDQL
jgi:hypothetical protein